MSFHHGLPEPVTFICTKGRRFTLLPDKTIEFEHPSMCRLLVLESELTRYEFRQPMSLGWSSVWYGPRPGQPVASMELRVMDTLDNSIRYMRFEVIRLEWAEDVVAA